MIENNIVVKRKRKLNFSLLNKVTPLGYNGQTYTNTLSGPSWSTNLTITLTYSWNGNTNENQQWSISGSNSITPTPPAGLYWFTPAAGAGGTGFEYRYSTDGGATYTSYATINVGGFSLTNTLTPGATTSQSITYIINVRNKSSPQIVVSSTVTLVNTYVGLTYSVFSSSGTYTVPSGKSLVYLWLVGGGGGGVSTELNAVGSGEGGGGAGQVIQSYAFNVTPGEVLSVSVGAGGAADGNGSNTGVFKIGGGNLIALGGSAGVGTLGGRAGSSGSGQLGGTAVPYSLGVYNTDGGGGGGQSGPGQNAVTNAGGSGGSGATFTVNSVTYIVGGGGGGGSGIGSNGSGGNSTAGDTYTNAQANRGGGGGGARGDTNCPVQVYGPTNGGSGLVIIGV